MESKVDYTLTGLFLLLFSSALIAFAFWLGKYNDNVRAYTHYKVYLTESVAGLAPEAAVKFHGVDVGKVESLRINPKNSEEVELTLKVKKETPIKIDSFATLKFYGITGLAYLEIEGGSKNAPLLSGDDERIATIATSPSLIKRLDESLSSVATKLSTTLDRADRLFSDQNIHNVAQSLDHLRSLTEQIDGYQNKIKLLLTQAIALENNASHTIETINETARSAKSSSLEIQTKLSTTLQSLETTSKNSHALIQKIESTMDRGDYNLQTITAPTLNELNDLIERSKTLTQEMEATIHTLHQSPSDLLLKKSKPKPGPGE
ncbi:MAG: MlaD family protein [Sulfuricurvum sp.]|jgi:phospholipid/cholesterol/gamma-HCH transport system substrate-binding protein